MINTQVDLKRIAGLPTPVAVPCYLFTQENHPIVKLQRLIDCFEVIVKYSAFIAVQSFFAERMGQRSGTTAKLILERIQRPTLGSYAEMLREVLKEPGGLKGSPFICGVRPLGSMKEADRLLALRNEFKGHGATPDEALAEGKLDDYLPDFMALLNAASPLANLPLHLVIEPGRDGNWTTRRFRGFSSGAQNARTPSASFLEAGHLVIIDPESQVAMDLYPLMIAQAGGSRQGRLLFFNGRKRNAIRFLDYELGEHHEFPIPAEVESCFERRFPRPPIAPLGTGEPAPDWFDELIGTTTEHFVGRTSELTRLEMFSAGGAKQVLVVTGAPGVGKTSLLAAWTKKETCFRHFIREADAATYEPARIFENLGLQLARVHHLEWSRPISGHVADLLNEFRRLLTGAAAKARSPILILIDGLDEAERAALRSSPTGRVKTLIDWLPSPETLPRNVYLILSTRPELAQSKTFVAKFGADKADTLPLGRLSEDDVRAMLYQVCNWYEVSASPHLVKTVLEKSEGSPIYVRLLVEDLAGGSIRLADIDRLPRGVGAFFDRILAALEQACRGSEKAELEAQFRAKLHVLKELEKQGKISSADVEGTCRTARKEMERCASTSCLELLALFALAKEPLDIPTASVMLGDGQERVERALHAARNVLDAQGDRFVLFHSAFRRFFSAQRSEVTARVRARLVDWCARYRQHRNGYALRHYVAHLCDELTGGGETVDGEAALAALERTLTDFTFIDLRSKGGSVAELLRDYRQALAIWPGHAQYDPFDVPPLPSAETWTRECVRAVLSGASDPHPDRSAASVVGHVSGSADKQDMPLYFVPHEPLTSSDQDLPSQYFAEGSATSCTVQEMLAPRSSACDSGPPGRGGASSRRIEEFLGFVSSHRHLLHREGADVPALAYNQGLKGEVASKADLICREKTQVWIKRYNRPSAATGHPLLVRPLSEGESAFISPDFQRAAVADYRSAQQDDVSIVTFKFIDLRTGQELRAVSQTIPSEQVRLTSSDRLVVSADLKVAIFGNAVWELETGKLTVALGGGTLRACAISPCGQMGVVATNERYLRIWDLQAGEIVRILEEENTEVHDLCMSRDGKVVAVANHWGEMTLWDVARAEPFLQFNDGDHMHSVALTPDARFVTCGGDSGRVWVLDVAKGVVLRRFTDQSHDFFGVAITPDGRIVAAQDSEYLRVWDVRSGRLLRRITISAIPLRVKLSSDGALAAAGSHILDLRQGEPPTGEPCQCAVPTSAAISSDGRKVLMGDSDGGAALYGFSDSERLLTFGRPATTPPESEDGWRIHLLPPTMNLEGSTALLPYTDGLLYLANVITGEIRLANSPEFVRRLVLEELPKKEATAARVCGEEWLPADLRERGNRRPNSHYGMTEAALTPDGRYAVTARFGEAVRVWDTSTGECVHALPTPSTHSPSEGEVMRLAPMPDSQGVVFATQDGRIHIWRFAAGAEAYLLPRDEYNNRPQMAISADGARIVFGGWFGPIELWDIPERRLVMTFDQEPDAMAERLAISRDGAYVVVASGSETLGNEIVVWNIASGLPIARYPLPCNPAHLSELSEDGRFVCTTDNGEMHCLSLENACPAYPPRSDPQR
jgi:WD40 repeat protein